MPFWGKLSFQDGLSFEMEQIIFFHDYSMILVFIISLMVFYATFISFFFKYFDSFMMENYTVELIWTCLPAISLFFLAFPSMKILYLIEETLKPSMTFKINGHQWYWSYEVSNLWFDLDSFIENSLILRVLKTSNILMLPLYGSIRGLISSSDVIHSWTVPSMGVKMDAVPGRLNQFFFSPKKVSLSVGQCSEICGANHSFMPIVVLFLSTD